MAARIAPEGTAVAVLTAEGLDRLLDYRAPEGGVGPGDFVEVPLGPRRVLGLVWGPGAASRPASCATWRDGSTCRRCGRKCGPPGRAAD